MSRYFKFYLFTTYNDKVIILQFIVSKQAKLVLTDTNNMLFKIFLVIIPAMSYNPPTTTTTTVSLPFLRDHPGEPVPEENFWNLDFMVQRKINRQKRQTHRPSGWAPLHPDQPVLTSTILPIFFTGRMPFLPPNQQHQSTKGKTRQKASRITHTLGVQFHVYPGKSKI